MFLCSASSNAFPSFSFSLIISLSGSLGQGFLSFKGLSFSLSSQSLMHCGSWILKLWSMLVPSTDIAFASSRPSPKPLRGLHHCYRAVSKGREQIEGNWPGYNNCQGKFKTITINSTQNDIVNALTNHLLSQGNTRGTNTYQLKNFQGG